ncbi:hypothetical protein C2845_PM07G11280 [Panicum miliaceum]|uniref:Uncharacterized protein n=1 Tax=Panicum miliaceum TaxID=4540 RepID=A0A3L6SIQ0_PANMI|nr:hypothetical protein C2845_PM07G11280 [Panicum miliaceum]
MGMLPKLMIPTTVGATTQPQGTAGTGSPSQMALGTQPSVMYNQQPPTRVPDQASDSQSMTPQQQATGNPYGLFTPQPMAYMLMQQMGNQPQMAAH